MFWFWWVRRCFGTAGLVIYISNKCHLQFLMVQKQVSLDSLGIDGAAAVAVGSMPDWLEVTPDSGTGDGVLLFTAQENTTLESRSHDVVVRMVNGDKEVTVHVVQAAGDPYLWVTSKGQTVENLDFGAAGGTQTVDVLSNTEWTTAPPQGIKE